MKMKKKKNTFTLTQLDFVFISKEKNYVPLFWCCISGLLIKFKYILILTNKTCYYFF